MRITIEGTPTELAAANNISITIDLDETDLEDSVRLELSELGAHEAELQQDLFDPEHPYGAPSQEHLLPKKPKRPRKYTREEN